MPKWRLVVGVVMPMMLMMMLLLVVVVVMLMTLLIMLLIPCRALWWRRTEVVEGRCSGGPRVAEGVSGRGWGGQGAEVSVCMLGGGCRPSTN